MIKNRTISKRILFGSYRDNIMAFTILMAFVLSHVLGTTAVAGSPKRFGIIIANDKYLHTENVRFARRDATAIKSMFKDVFNIPSSAILHLRNQTRTDMEYLFGGYQDFGQLPSLISGDDTEIFIYYVGHGSKEFDQTIQRSKPYLLGMDSRPDNLKRTAYPLNSLLKKLTAFQNRFLPKGHITLMLESCFSGQTHAGKLLSRKPDSAALTAHLSITIPDRGVSVFSAAHSNQVAVWDIQNRHGIFTEALVSGFYGEADDPRFGGNGDKTITAKEITNFLQKRVAWQVEQSRPEFDQTPEVLGRRPDEVIVRLSPEIPPFIDAYRRQQQEKIESGQALASNNEKAIRKFLSTCLYCPKAKQMRSFLREKRERTSYCKIEKEFVTRLSRSGSIKHINTFKKVCRCCPDIYLLEDRLSRLQGPSREQLQDDSLWSKALIKKTIDGFLTYRSSCKVCRYKKNAQQRVNAICRIKLEQKERSWKRARTRRQLNRYINSCQKLPAICGTCAHLEEARERLARRDRRNLTSHQETLTFRKVLALNTSKDYYHFLKKYPHGQYSAEVRQRMQRAHEEESLWESALKQNMLQSFKYYREKYPGGRFYQEAEQHIQRLQDERDWQEALRLKTERSFQNYLIKRPDGRYAVYARKKLEKF